jgi:hypothetical protein
MKKSHQHKSFNKIDLNKRLKSELIDDILKLQEYALKLESVIEEDQQLVRISHDIFYQDRDFAPEIISFISDISNAELGEVGESGNWIIVDGKIRPNFVIDLIHKEHSSGWERWFSKAYMLPKKFVEPIKNLIYSLNTRSGELKKKYEEDGRNWLIQQSKEDILGK